MKKRFIIPLCAVLLMCGCTEGTISESTETTSSAQSMNAEDMYAAIYVAHKSCINQKDATIKNELAAFRVLETYDPEGDAPMEYRTFVVLDPDNSEEYQAILFQELAGVQKELTIEAVPSCTADGFWLIDRARNVQVYNYALEQTQVIEMPDFSQCSVHIETETVYYTTESGDVMRYGFDGQETLLCRIQDIQITQLHACAEELLWIGEQDGKSCYGRISLQNPAVTVLNTRTDGGAYQLSPFDGGALISDADRYDDTTISGTVHYLKDGTDAEMELKYPLESKAAFVACDGAYIVTNHAFVPEETGQITGCLRFYQPDGSFYRKLYLGASGEDSERKGEAFFHQMLDQEQIFVASDIERVYGVSRIAPGTPMMFNASNYSESILRERNEWEDCDTP